MENVSTVHWSLHYVRPQGHPINWSDRRIGQEEVHSFTHHTIHLQNSWLQIMEMTIRSLKKGSDRILEGEICHWLFIMVARTSMFRGSAPLNCWRICLPAPYFWTSQKHLNGLYVGTCMSIPNNHTSTTNQCQPLSLIFNAPENNKQERVHLWVEEPLIYGGNFHPKWIKHLHPELIHLPLRPGFSPCTKKKLCTFCRNLPKELYPPIGLQINKREASCEICSQDGLCCAGCWSL